MSAHIVDGVDRALARFRQHAHETAILRHTTPTTPTPEPRTPTNREIPDKLQVIGIPLFIMRTPPLRRKPIDEPR